MRGKPRLNLCPWEGMGISMAIDGNGTSHFLPYDHQTSGEIDFANALSLPPLFPIWASASDGLRGKALIDPSTHSLTIFRGHWLRW